MNDFRKYTPQKVSTPRRHWSRKLGGYSYDGKHLTKCQCNISGSKCKCGNFEADRKKELRRQRRLDK